MDSAAHAARGQVGPGQRKGQGRLGNAHTDDDLDRSQRQLDQLVGEIKEKTCETQAGIGGRLIDMLASNEDDPTAIWRPPLRDQAP